MNLNVEETKRIIEFITVFMMIGIILVYLYSCYLNIKFNMKTKWKCCYSTLYLYTACVSFFMSGVFSFLFYNFLIGKPIEISFYGGVIIRPLVFMIGCATAANAQARLKLLERGYLEIPPK